MFHDQKRYSDTRHSKSFQGYADDYLELNLNRSKCCYVAYNCQGQIRFQHGEPINLQRKPHIWERPSRSTLTLDIISATMAILRKLDLFWIKTHCSKKWKLLVFNAVITSRVLYGLETLDPTEAAGRLLSTFQLFSTKGFAKKSKTTHHVRAAQQFQWICV